MMWMCNTMVYIQRIQGSWLHNGTVPWHTHVQQRKQENTRRKNLFVHETQIHHQGLLMAGYCEQRAHSQGVPPPRLDFVDLGAGNHRVIGGQGLPPSSLVIKRAAVLFCIAVRCAIHIAAAALEPCKPHTLVAIKASVGVELHRLAFLILGTRCSCSWRGGRGREHITHVLR